MEQVFPEAERKVFAYHDGTQVVYGDPMRLLRGLILAFDGNPNAVLERLASEEPAIWAPACEELIPVIRDVFGMVPFDPTTGRGATDKDCLAALEAWQGWLAAKKEPAAS